MSRWTTTDRGPTQRPAGRWLAVVGLASLAVAGAGTGAVSCSPPDGDTVEITATRPATERDRRIKVGAAVEERFADLFRPAAPAGTGMPGASDAGGLEGAFAWDTPDGWSELPPQGAFRLANLTFGPEGEGECYFGVLGGAGGGLLANVNRWRGQMGLDPVSEEELEAMPKKPFFRRDATFVDVEGTFTGMGAGSREGYRMLGLIHSGPQFTLFAKMTGPAALVGQEEAAFHEFVGSLGLAAEAAPEGEGVAE